MSLERQAIDLLASFIQVDDSQPCNALATTMTLPQAVGSWFPHLDEELLRRLLSQAMRAEEEDRRSLWSLIIDSIREETTRRQQVASDTMKELLEACHADRLESVIHKLRSHNRIDYIVIAHFKLMKEQAEERHDQALVTILDHILSHLQPPSPLKQGALEISVEALVEAGDYLQSLLKQSSGDANQLCSQLQQDFGTPGRVQAPALLRVLDDNIEACRSAGYLNKLKLFIFIKVSGITTHFNTKLA